MESNSGVKSSHAMMDGVERGSHDHHHHGGGGSSKGCKTGEVVLRIGALLLTLAAAIVMGVDKQTKTVPLQLLPTLPPVNVPVTAKWHYLSAFVFFVVANAIACSYALLSIVIALAGKRGMASAVTMMMDLLMVALLFAGNGAATAVGLLGRNGNSHVRWNKVCNVFDKFCHQVAASIGLSLIGSLLFVLIVLLAVVRLHRKSS
ncbi:CASP-like protein 1E1 [Linum grandiflorum]